MCDSIVKVKIKLKGHQKRITGLAFSNSLNVLISAGADSQVNFVGIVVLLVEKAYFICSSPSLMVK